MSAAPDISTVLIQRLRRELPWIGVVRIDETFEMVVAEAADRIEELEAELERTRQAWVDGDDPLCEDLHRGVQRAVRGGVMSDLTERLLAEIPYGVWRRGELAWHETRTRWGADDRPEHAGPDAVFDPGVGRLAADHIKELEAEVQRGQPTPNIQQTPNGVPNKQQKETPMNTNNITIYYSPTYTHSGANFDTHLKANLVANKIERLQSNQLQIVAPTPATPNELDTIHSKPYTEAIMTGTPPALARSNGFPWTPELRNGVLASTGGVRDAAITALTTGGISGSLSSGLHHASWKKGKGFCTINGLALAAVTARNNGAERVVILDVDAHCGGGTAEIIRLLDNTIGGITQHDVSVSAFDHYHDDPIATCTMTNGHNYLNTIASTLNTIEDDPRPVDLLLLNAGMDPHELAGGVSGISDDVIAERERMIFDWAVNRHVPVAFVLAGGYTGLLDLGEVADLHMITINAAVKAA